MSDKYILYARKSSESEERQALSIDSQVNELTSLAKQQGLKIVETITEARSAKTPGRPEFARMMAILNEKRANGILCWKLDRLARNPVDGGSVIWALDTGAISTIVIPGRVFKKSGEDAFWMSLEFGIAKKYVDDLSDNVKRGLRARAESGNPPISKPPLGYLWNRTSKRMVPDPKRFALVRRLWDDVLRDDMSPLKVLEMANDKWGLTTRAYGRKGGKGLSKTAFYHLLGNTYYAGLYSWGGKNYKGAYRPMISLDEFQRVQAILRRDKPRPKTSVLFPYRGLLICDACKRMATAEAKMNRFGSRYVYYHCARGPQRMACKEPSIEERLIESEISRFLETMPSDPSLLRWALAQLDDLDLESAQMKTTIKESLREKLAGIERKLDNLTDMRLRDQVDDRQYDRLRITLVLEREDTAQRLGSSDMVVSVIEPLRGAISIARLAKNRFDNGTPEEKREVTREVVSNLFVANKKLRIIARKPYQLVASISQFPTRHGL